MDETTEAAWRRIFEAVHRAAVCRWLGHAVEPDMGQVCPKCGDYAQGD